MTDQEIKDHIVSVTEKPDWASFIATVNTSDREECACKAVDNMGNKTLKDIERAIDLIELG